MHIAKPAPALADELGMQYYGSPFFASKTSFGSVIGSVGGAYGYSTLRSELGEGYTLGPVVDVNADGRDDVLIASPGIPTWRVLEATDAPGQAFAGWTVKELPAPAPPSTWIYSRTLNQHLLAGRGYAMDINGDGVKDFVQKPTATIGGAELAGYVRRGPQTRKLAAVTDGLGRRVEFEYGQLSAPRLPIEPTHPLRAFLSEPIYDEPDSAACLAPDNFRCLPPRHSVVARHRVLQGPQEFPAFSREFEHRYSSARIGLNGRGWLGFARHQVNEPATFQTKDFRFENVWFDALSHAFPFAHQVSRMYERTTYLRADDETIVRTVSRERSSDLLHHPSSSQVVRPYSRVTTERLEEGRLDTTADLLGEVTHTTDIDLFGNIKHVTTEWSGPDALSTDTLDVTYMHEEDPSFVDSWLVSLPRRRVVTSSGVVGESEQGTHTRTVEQDYFPTGLLRRVTVEPDRPELLVSTEFFRNAYGAVEVIETCGGSIECDDERKRTAVTSYDEERQVFPRTVVDAEGYETELTFHHGLGVVTGSVQRGSEGSRELTTYSAADGFGRIRAIRFPDARESRVDYESDSLGGMNVVSAESGRPRVTVGYDPLGREARRFTQTLGGEELAEFTRYNVFGEIFDVTRPMIQSGLGELQATQYDYDGLGRLRYRFDADGTVRETCHDGLVTCVRDGRENVRCTEADGRGRLRFAADPVPDVGQGCAGVAADFKDTPTSSRRGIQYVRGPFGVIERVVHAETGSSLVSVTSDPLGRPEERTEAGVGTKSFTYTPFGQVETETDAHGTVTFGYDKLDRRTSRDDADGHTEWAWRRDMPGRFDHSRTPEGTLSAVGYDELGRADSLLREVDGEEFEARVAEWDGSGRAKILSYPGDGGAFSIENVYDEASGILKKVQSVPPEGSGETPQTYWQLDQINEFGQLEQESFGNSFVTSRTYHPLTGLQDSIRTFDPTSGQAVQDLAHSYDLNGNLESKVDLTQGVTETFFYDKFDRLDRVWQNNSLVSDYEYTEFGSLDTNGAGWGYEYEPGRPHAVHAVTNDGESSTFTYDSRGNLEHRTVGVLPELNVEYTPASKVRRIWEDDEGAAEQFSYDADQIKVAKSSPRESVIYFGDLYYRIDDPATGSRVHHFVITNGQRAVAEVTRTQGGTEPDAVVYLHEDHLGSVSVLTKGAPGGGEVAERRSFGHFGALELPTGASLSSFGYTGHQQDQEHGLIDMRGRTYDPRVGQFLSPDPLVTSPFMSAAFNRYSYVLNNPLRFVDPTGFQPCDGTSCGAGGAGGFGIQLPPSGSEGAGNISLSAAPFAPTFSTGVTASQDGAGGTTGVEAEATLGERALYLGAGVGVSVGTGYVIGKGVLFLCTATTVCTPVVIAVAVVGGTAYVVNELFFDGGAERIATAFTEFKTKEDAFVVGEVVGGVGLGVGGVLRATAATRVNVVPSMLARVIPGEGPFLKLGPPGKLDVFVTAADDIAGLNATEIAKRLTIPESSTYTVIVFPTPAEGLASPILRSDVGFVGRGFTAGGAREFVVPNGPIPAGATIEVLTW